MLGANDHRESWSIDVLIEQFEQLLLHQLGFRVLRQVLALGGEADAEGRLRQAGDPGEDVRVLLQIERQVLAVALLDPNRTVERGDVRLLRR
jgi:hypothetical protein